MQTRTASHLSLVLLIVASGCGTAADDRPAACKIPGDDTEFIPLPEG